MSDQSSAPAGGKRSRAEEDVTASDVPEMPPADLDDSDDEIGRSYSHKVDRMSS